MWNFCSISCIARDTFDIDWWTNSALSSVNSCLDGALRGFTLALSIKLMNWVKRTTIITRASLRHFWEIHIDHRTSTGCGPRPDDYCWRSLSGGRVRFCPPSLINIGARWLHLGGEWVGQMVGNWWGNERARSISIWRPPPTSAPRSNALAHVFRLRAKKSKYLHSRF